VVYMRYYAEIAGALDVFHRAILPWLFLCSTCVTFIQSDKYQIWGASVPAPSKRDKQSVKRGAHNKGVRTRLRNLSKSFYRAVESGDEGEARRIRDESQSEYDKAAGKGIIHPNRAARKVSRLDNALAADRSE
jgi:small subunit ribosomal protein S20